HLWQIDELRHLGAKTVTVVLGGDFSQRGRPAAFSKFTRARAALLNGADLVLELPLPWCAASAEGFARGGIALLAGIGCIDTLSFGAECADAVVLQQLSRLFQQSSFDAALKTELSRGVSYPAARAAAAENFLPNSSTALNGANNILGIEYLAACRALHFAPQLAVLPRQGAAHDATLEQDGFASASALREAL
ncbi:MAG: nucleotidyltransferase family protein, partial [Ruthenibacterium sp.]